MDNRACVLYYPWLMYSGLLMQKVALMAIKESSCKKYHAHFNCISSVEYKTAVMEACKRSGVLMPSLIVLLLLGYGIMCSIFHYYSILLLFDFFSGAAHECYYLPDCLAESFPVESARQCCVGTEDGVSYSHDGDCIIRQCILERKTAIEQDTASKHFTFIQFMHGIVHVESVFNSIQ